MILDYDARKERWLLKSLGEIGQLSLDEDGSYTYTDLASGSPLASLRFEAGQLILQGPSARVVAALAEKIRAHCADLLALSTKQPIVPPKSTPNPEDVVPHLESMLDNFGLPEMLGVGGSFWKNANRAMEGLHGPNGERPTVNWAIESFLADRAKKVSRATVSRDDHYLGLAKMALDHSRPLGFLATRFWGTAKFSERASCAVLPDALEMILSYAHSLFQGRTDHKYWKELRVTLRHFYRWLALRGVMSTDERKVVDELLG